MFKRHPAHILAPVRLVFLAALFTLCGCSVLGLGEKPVPQQGDPHAAYVLAVDSYLSGQYEKAGSIFQRLSGDPRDPVVARKAYFGLACSRMAMARNSAELHEALGIWNTWVQMTPEGLPDEDPRLMTPLLARLGPGAGAGSPPMLTEDEIERELSRTRRLAGCREETDKVKDSLRRKTAEAEALRSQLRALERLHQEITMKKKGLE